MDSTKLAQEGIEALRRLKNGVRWQDIADRLTRELGDGRIVWKSEVWRGANGQISRKVIEGLQAAGEIPGPRKRYRLHAEFQSKEEIQDFMDYYGIDNQTFTFTAWVKDQFMQDLYVNDELEFMAHYLRDETLLLEKEGANDQQETISKWADGNRGHGL